MGRSPDAIFVEDLAQGAATAGVSSRSPSRPVSLRKERGPQNGQGRSRVNERGAMSPPLAWSRGWKLCLETVLVLSLRGPVDASVFFLERNGQCETLLLAQGGNFRCHKI